MHKFCPIPWVFQAVRNNGDVRVCCQANQSQSKGILRKSTGDAYNVAVDTLDDAWNADLIREVRLSMINNKPHEMCVRCDKEEEAGNTSRRQYENETWDFSLNDAISCTSDDGHVNIDPFYYDLRFGNLCNLKCRMCGPTDSSMWYQDFIKMGIIQFKDSHGIVTIDGKSTINRDYDWINGDKFWSDIEHKIPSAKRFYIVGGEPLIIERHYNFLEKCIELGYANQIEIEYNTNGVNIPEKAFDLWKHFKEVKIGVSIDGAFNVNDYIRYPSKFSSIEKTLDRLDNTADNIKVWTSCTIQVLNVLYIPEFCDWLIGKQYKKINLTRKKPITTYHMLHGPQYYNIKSLPNHTKQIVDNKLKDWSQRVNGKYNTQAVQIYKDISTFMFKEQYDSIDKFFEITDQLDHIRNQKLETELTELYKALK